MTDEKRHEMGPGGFCVCPKCEHRFPHGQGVPCQDRRCPNCGAKMLREGSWHHDLFQKKKLQKRQQKQQQQERTEL